ncbi:MAG: AraC family transcriptional regulator, partial [Flavobacterium sp.]
MENRIELLTAKKLVGIRLAMSFTDNRTFELWNRFMPIANAIQNRIGSDLISMQLYPDGFFDNFDPNATFYKWAAVEVSEFATIPPELETYLLPAGLYSVFLYKGRAADASATFKFILGPWMAGSGYKLDS